MREAAAFRVSADLCLFFALLSLLFPETAPLWLPAAFVGGCLVCGTLAVSVENPALRMLAAAPPLLLCLVAASLPLRLALAAGGLYYLLTLAFVRGGMEYWRYRRIFPVCAAVLLLACLWVGANRTLGGDAPWGVLGFSFAFCCLGMLTLRALRMGASTDLGWKLWSAAELVLPPVAAGGLGMLLWLLFRNAGRVFEVIFSLVFWAIYYFSAFMGRLWGSLADPDEFYEAPMPTPDTPQLPGIETGTAEAARQTEALDLPELPAFPWRAALIVAGVAVAAVLLVLYLRGLRRTEADPTAAPMQEERFRARRTRKKQNAPSAPAERVRRAYRDYLRGLELRGQRIGQGDTSEDIERGGKTARSEAERSLRALYLKARYADPKAVTETDAAEAEALAEAIRTEDGAV